MPENLKIFCHFIQEQNTMAEKKAVSVKYFYPGLRKIFNLKKKNETEI